jgi:glutamate dehydrogenase
MSATSTSPLPRPGLRVLHDPTIQQLQNGSHSSSASSRTSSEASLQRVKNLPGYTTAVFKGKEEQRAKVQVDVAAKVRIAIVVISIECT